MASTDTTTIDHQARTDSGPILAAFDTHHRVTYTLHTSHRPGLVDLWTYGPGPGETGWRLRGVLLSEALRWVADDIDQHEPF